MPASPYDLCAQERDRLLDKVAALEVELAEANRCLHELTGETSSALLLEWLENDRNTEQAFAAALRERDEARAERDALRGFVKDLAAADKAITELATPKTEEGGK